MDIFLPIAQIHENFLVLISLGFVSGVLSGLLGIGGGVVLTPALILLGISPTVAVATSANQMIGTSLTGVYTHYRYGSIDLKLGSVIIAGSLLGGLTGVYLIYYFHQLGKADLIISSSYIIILGLVGVYMLLDAGHFVKESSSSSTQTRLQDFLFNLSLKMTFERTGLSVSAIPLIGAGFIAGMMSSLMGVGGGFLIVPLLVYLLGLPMLLVTGTSLLQIFFSSVFITFLQSVMNHNVDLILASILLFGSSIGVIVGIKVAKRQEEAHLKLLLSVIISLVTGVMAYHLWFPGDTLLLKPSNPYLPVNRPEDDWLTFFSLFHSVQYGILSVLTALVIGLILAIFFKKGESLWNR